MSLPRADTEQAHAAAVPFAQRFIHHSGWKLAVIVGLALLLRVLFLGKSLWLDEGVAFMDAFAHGLPIGQWREWFRQLWQAEFNMVFYFALLRLWMQAGTSEAYLRLLSVFPAVATIPVIYSLGKRMYSERVALIAALLLAVHGSHIGYSQEIRGYTLVVFLSATSTLLLVLGIEEQRNRYWVLYWIVSALAVYTHFFGGLVVAAQWASLLWAAPRTVPWRKLGLSSIAFALSITPAVLFVITNRGQQVDWIPRPSFGQLANVISELAGSPSALPVYVALWCFGIGYAARKHPAGKNDSRRWHMALIISWAVLPTVLALILSLKRPMLVPRYLLVSAPAAVLLAAVGAADISWRRGKVLIWAAAALSLAFVVVRYARPKENWRGASDYVLSQAHPGDAVAVVPWWSEAPFAYYKLRLSNSEIAEVPASEVTDKAQVAKLAGKYKRIWILVYARPQGLNDTQTGASETELGSNFEVAQKREFRWVQVRLYVSKP